MTLSKKEISILVEIIYSIVFALIFLPYFYENQEKTLILMDGVIEKIFQIIISTVIYFSIAYSVLEVIYKKKETGDERDDMINSKSYKLGYLLYEFSLFIFIGYICSKFQNKELLNLTGNQELYNSFELTDGGIVFFCSCSARIYIYHKIIVSVLLIQNRLK